MEKSLPVIMQSSVGVDEANKKLDSMIEEEKEEVNGDEMSSRGCICEIDLSQRKKIAEIMANMIAKQSSN